MANRLSQDVVEVLFGPTPAARVSQDDVEVLYRPAPAARLSQDVVEILMGPPAPPVGDLLSQILVEVLQLGPATGPAPVGQEPRATQVVIESIALSTSVIARVTLVPVEVAVEASSLTKTTQVAVEVIVGGIVQATLLSACFDAVQTSFEFVANHDTSTWIALVPEPV